MADDYQRMPAEQLALWPGDNACPQGGGLLKIFVYFDSDEGRMTCGERLPNLADVRHPIIFADAVMGKFGIVIGFLRRLY